jgi:hypothetical protein
LVVANGANDPDDPPPPLQIYRREADGFVAGAAIPGCTEAQGLIAADFDNDGDEDLLLGVREGRVHLLENITEREGQGLSVKLVGTVSNRDGRGAIIIARFADDHQVLRSIGSGGVAFSSPPPRAFFGLAGSELAELTITWPSGIVDRFDGPFDGETLRLREGSAP